MTIKKEASAQDASSIEMIENSVILIHEYSFQRIFL